MSSLVSSIFGSQPEAEPSAAIFDAGEQFQNIPAKKDYHERSSRRKSKTKESAEPKHEPKDTRSEKEKEECTVFVGNLPVNTTRKTLTKIFADCGTIASTRIRSAPVTPVKVSQKGDFNLVRRAATLTGKLDSAHKASVHGYVVFASVESVPKALELNNTLFPGESSRRIRVDRAEPTWIENSKRAVFVGNLPFDDPNAETDLQQHFARCCGCSEEEIEGVRVIRDRSTYLGKGFGYVLFKTSQLQSTALQCMQDTTYKNRTLRVTACTKNKKRKNPESKPTDHDKDKKKREKVKNSGVQNDAVGALKRILVKESESGHSNKKRRARATSKPKAHKAAGGKKKTKPEDKKLRKMIQNKVNQVRSERRRR